MQLVATIIGSIIVLLVIVGICGLVVGCICWCVQVQRQRRDLVVVTMETGGGEDQNHRQQVGTMEQYLQYIKNNK